MKILATDRLSVLSLAVLAGFLALSLVVTLWPAFRSGPPSGVWLLKDATYLEQIHIAATSSLRSSDTQTAPRTWWNLTRADGFIDELTRSNRSRLTVEELKSRSFPAVVLPADWEQLGDFVLSRAPEAFDTENEALVAGFGLLAWKRRGSTQGVFVFANNSSRVVAITQRGEPAEEYADLIAADRAAREELGLSEPPDYAAVIREYAEKQKGR